MAQLFEGVVSLIKDAIVDDAFFIEEIIDLEQAIYVASKDSPASHECQISPWVSLISFDHEVAIALIQFRSFVCFARKELFEMLSFDLMNLLC